MTGEARRGASSALQIPLRHSSTPEIRLRTLLSFLVPYMRQIAYVYSRYIAVHSNIANRENE